MRGEDYYKLMETDLNNTTFNNIKALVFDYGGTLDTAGRHWAHVLREGYTAAGIALPDDRWREAYVFGERALAKEYIVVPQDNFRDMLVKKIDKEFLCLEDSGSLCCKAGERSTLVARIAGYCYDYALRHIEMSRNVITTLSKRYPIALVSNFYGNLHAVLDDFGLGGFNALIESSVVGVRKPDPAIFRLGVEALGYAAAETLVIGDSYDKDIVPAASIGCPTVWVCGEGWGKAPEDTSIPKETISDVRQLLALLP